MDEEWKKVCGETNFDNCILENAQGFDDDVSKMQDAVSKVDKSFNEIKNIKINDGCDSITDTLKREYCSLIRLDADKEVINEGEIRAVLLQNEKANLDWSDKIKNTRIKDGSLEQTITQININKFIEQDVSLRNEADLKKEEKEKIRDLFYDDKGQPRPYEELIKIQNNPYINDMINSPK